MASVRLGLGAQIQTRRNRAERHVRFLNLKTDEDLVAFVRAWGPLWLGGSDQEPNGKFPRSWCWAFQLKLIAEVGLVQSLKSGDKAALADALLKYVAAKDGWQNAEVPRTNAFTESVIAKLITSDKGVLSEDWIRKAGISSLREAAARCVSTFGLDFALCAAWTDGKPKLEWKPSFTHTGRCNPMGVMEQLHGCNAPHNL